MGLLRSMSAMPFLHAPVRVPPRARPFVRLLLVAILVLIVDTVTGELSRQGIRFDAWVVTVLRVAAPVLIFRYPLAGFVFALEVDKWDWFWLGMLDRSGVEQAWYQEWNKILDLVTLAAAAAVTLRWNDPIAKRLALAAFAYRLVGVALFEITDSRWMLILFPNVFETIYIVYMLFRVLTARDEMLGSKTGAAVMLVALLIPQVGQEIFLHQLEDRPWNLWRLLPFPNFDAWLWGGLFYLLPVVTLVTLVHLSEGRATRRDPEVEVDATPAVPVTPSTP